MDASEEPQAFKIVAWDEDEETIAAQTASPAVTPTPPSTPPPSARQRLRKRSDGDISNRVSRPTLNGRSIAAPPGTLPLRSPTKSQPPRRASSVRMNRRPSQHRGSKLRQTHKPSPATPRVSYLGTSTAKSIIGQRMTSGKAAWKRGLKPDRYVWRLSRRAAPQSQLKPEAEDDGSKAPPEVKSSFSEKARVKETLEKKKLDPLRPAPFDDFNRNLPDTPESMGTTPMKASGPTSSNSSKQGYRGSILDSSGSLTSELSLLDAALSRQRDKHLSLPLIAYDGWKAALEQANAERKAKANHRWTTLYEPGPIRIEEKTAGTLQKRCRASRDRWGGMDRVNETEPAAKRFSDVVAMDSIVCFFQDLGIGAESSEECLDRYWVPKRRSSRGIVRQKAGGGQAAVSPSAPLSRRSVTLAWQTARQREGRLPPSPETPGRQGLRSYLKSHRTLA